MPDTGIIPAPATPHDLLIAVRDVIRDNPERHDQRAWVSNVFGETIEAEAGELREYATLPVPALPGNPESPKYPKCGTTACVAGWAVILGANPYTIVADGGFIEDLAQDLLNLSSYNQATYLFSGSRTRDEVLAMLNMLIEDPDADLDTVLYSANG